MENQRENLVENLTETKLRRILINFDRKFQENQKLRIKHVDEPSKFAASETELFAALDELQNIACQPEFYHLMISKKALSTLVSLLTHENTDISSKVVGMLQEFADVDEPDEQGPVELLVAALKQENIMDHLVSNLSRLDEGVKEEAQAINNTVSLIDNLVDLNSEFATLNSETLIKWILGVLKKTTEFNQVKLSVAELLSVLLLNARENKLYLGQANGIDVLLQQVAYYRRVAPVTGDEHEFLEQIINCLCTAILDCDENRELFFQDEGIDLMELLLRERSPAVQKSNLKVSILKLLNHVLTTDKSHDKIVSQCCERFVQVLGLRVLFPALNNPKLVLSGRTKKKRELRQTLDEVEEHTCAILLALLKYCQDLTLIQRALIKIAESNFEKLNRLVVLHDKYFKLVLNQQSAASDSSDNSSSDHHLSNSRAHFVLRTVDYIILLACYLSDHFETYDPSSGETFKNHISKLLARRPELKHQIVYEMRRHLEGVAEASPEEKGSLELLLGHFEKS